MEFIKHHPMQLKGNLFILVLFLFISCDKASHEIKDNSYKGYGFFYSYLIKQDGRRELIFIPVDNSKDELEHFDSKLKTGRGLSFSSYGGEKFIKEVYNNFMLISLKNKKNSPYELQNILYTPVYIEFDEAINSKDKKLSIKGYTDKLVLSNYQTLSLIYDPTEKDVLDVIEIKKLEIIYNMENKK